MAGSIKQRRFGHHWLCRDALRRWNPAAVSHFQSDKCPGDHRRANKYQDLYVHSRSQECVRRKSPICAVERRHRGHASSGDRSASGADFARPVQGQLRSRFEQRCQGDHLHSNLHLDERWRHEDRERYGQPDQGQRAQPRQDIPMHSECHEQSWNRANIECIGSRTRLGSGTLPSRTRIHAVEPHEVVVADDFVSHAEPAVRCVSIMAGRVRRSLPGALRGQSQLPCRRSRRVGRDASR